MQKIVIIEDENIIADDLKLTLESWGFEDVITVSSAEALLDHYDEIKPDLLLMDIKLRGKIDGVEAVNIIHKKYNTPVIYITAYANKETIERAAETHPIAYLIKPFEEYRLKEIVESVLK
ncbi:MAG: response regulator [Candidatus Marinimicrobia bacterium]|nr:response regulator [Candidatus Neomarinimicrobiota bacterium]MDD5582361.1 response regulator [Candidatus Neomarinimicrobiota bacterium]